MKSKNLHLYIRYLSDLHLSKSQLKIVLLRTCNKCCRLPRKSRCEDKVIKTTCVTLIHESRCEALSVGARISHFIPTSFHYKHNYSLLVPSSSRLMCEKCSSGIYKDKLLILLNPQCMKVINKLYFCCFCPHTLWSSNSFLVEKKD